MIDDFRSHFGLICEGRLQDFLAGRAKTFRINGTLRDAYGRVKGGTGYGLWAHERVSLRCNVDHGSTGFIPYGPPMTEYWERRVLDE